MELTSEIMLRKREIERMFAGAVFRRPDIALDGCQWLSPDVIHDDDVRKFWKMFLDTKDHTRAALEVGPIFMADLATMDTVYWGEGVRNYANHIMREAWYYDIATKLGPMSRALADDQVEDVIRLAKSMNGKAPASTEPIPDAADVGLEFIASLDNEPSVVATGTVIDEIAGGLWNGTETVLCARPAIGKTAFALQIARNISANGKRVLFSSMEMSRRLLWARAACGVERVAYSDLMARRLSEEVKDKLRTTSNTLMERYGMDLLIDETTGHTTSDLWRKVADTRAKVLIVDHVRLLADKDDNETRRLGAITWALKQIAKEFDIPVLALAQLNRQLESRNDKRPTLSDLRDSGQIEENADMVLGLHRERTYIETTSERSPADLVVMKFRDGPAGFYKKLVFDGLGQWFYDAK